MKKLIGMLLLGSLLSPVIGQVAIYKDKSQPVNARVQDLLGRMTLEEKVAQTLCVWQGKNAMILDDAGNFDPEKTAGSLPDGVGQIGRPSEGIDRTQGNRTARNMAEFTNTIQRYFLEETRLGIPVVFHEECLHGHAAKDGTSFPQPIALAGTWDTDLIRRLFEMTALETRSRGGHQALTPVVDVARDPRWGRFEETYGEDPYLVSRIGVAAIQGFQGEGPGIDKQHMLATLKHMTGHGQPESGMNVGPANISEREIREMFLPPFKACVQEAGAQSVMASYNEIDGIPSHSNDWLLNDILREEWGFNGYVVADYGGVDDLVGRHGVAENKPAAAALAIQSGVDIELPDMSCYPSLKEVFSGGEVPMAVLDTAVARLLRGKFLLGLFDDPYVDPDYADKIVGSEAHAQLALEAAQKSIVLLKNEGELLPLDVNDYRDIAVIGPNADRILLGGYSDVPPYFVTLKQGLEEQVGKKARIHYAEGTRLTEATGWYDWYIDEIGRPDPVENEARMREAVSVAKKADLIILAIGGNEQTSREAWAESHMGDRHELSLYGDQLELFQKMQATGKPVVVVLQHGRPLAIPEVKEEATAILECWYLGQESGRAIADVLFGEVNPSGKLAATFPRSVGHLPVFYNHKPTARRGFLFEEHSPLFPFGFGLSYTTFEYKNLRLEKSEINKWEPALALIEVTNTGERSGDEIVQLYIRDMFSSVTRPVKELKGFQKISLKPGETQTVRLEITPEKLAFFDRSMHFVVEPGEFQIMVGPSSAEYDTVSLIVRE